jgi:2-(1,2-epoxy-1,2-dihydrophenyl)acetyl-CoA isomerase
VKGADPGIDVERQQGVVLLRLARPEVLNAIDQRMRDSWIAELHRIQRELNASRVLVITGTGRAFCSGGDVTEQLDYMGPTAHDGWWGQYRYQELARMLHELPIPIIAAVNGIALGGGLAVALMADVRVASKDATFGVGQVVRALVPDVGLTYLLPRIVGVGRALELMMLNEPISAERAHQLGIVNWVVPADQVVDRAMSIAQQLTKYSGPALEWIKRVTYRGLDTSYEGSLQLEAMAQGILCNRPEFEVSVEEFKARRLRKRSAPGRPLT